eukprot:CAMPEP_0181272590 /NCGR_PEP_ID=MMETSP1097-20121128/8111_1 /TAXON_ID=35684 /ORGANISM="Pseudopedinella elastica, Strain CCMP716" /LENGTH=57 /DNA_ID=CAMNT_0023373287 /DNA_START=37 /DNA_END=207 /DNA_ORIENTATION=+
MSSFACSPAPSCSVPAPSSAKPFTSASFAGDSAAPAALATGRKGARAREALGRRRPP